MTTGKGAIPRGRHHEARRNDHAVLAAAREVFVANPAAKMSDVAARAGVGQASLYRRYRTKGELLNAVCADGMQSVARAAESALDGGADAGDAFADFMFHYVESGAGAQQILAGSFVADESLFDLAKHLYELTQRVVERAIAAGAVRPDVSASDIWLLAAQLSSLRSADQERDRELRRRYLALILDGLRPPDGGTLPGAAPNFAELQRLWRSQG